MSCDLILASSSPYRRALLERLGIAFRCETPDVDETPGSGESPEVLALRLSWEKALAVSVRHPGAMVLGSDQVATVDGGILAKPGSLERAREQLTRSSGQTVLFLTGVVLARNGKKLGERCVLTHVTFRELRPREIERYLERETPFDCAGSFRWEGLGICLFRALQSTDPTALEGLPLIAVTDLLAENDLPVL